MAETRDALKERQTDRGMRLSVVIPVLNESGGLEPLLARLVPVLVATGLAFEIVFVDDGSTDDTLDKLRRSHAADPRIRTVSFSRNFGKEIAVAAGLRYATGDVVVLMDADLQHPPELIPELLSRWRDGYDIVYGQRTDRDADSLSRRIFARAFYAAFRVLSGTELPTNAGDFRLLDRRAVDALNRLGERARFNKGLFAWIGFKSTGIPFDVPDRVHGEPSRWRPRKLLRFALDGLASFSTIPLRIWSYVGLTFSVLAFAYIVLFLAKTLLFGVDQAGFPTLIISIMFFAGVQLISLGVIGEYLGRIYEEVKARPLYLVAEEIGLDGAPEEGEKVARGIGDRVHQARADAAE
jgi:glycosyltransferase involved in cell wall biosynthesis